jgi:hypothetical protein
MKLSSPVTPARRPTPASRKLAWSGDGRPGAAIPEVAPLHYLWRHSSHLPETVGLEAVEGPAIRPIDTKEP